MNQNNLKQNTAEMGLKVNISKTKYMLVSTSKTQRNLKNLCIDGVSFEGVNRFWYLGNIIDNEGSINAVIQDRMQAV